MVQTTEAQENKCLGVSNTQLGHFPTCDHCGAPNTRSRTRYCSERCRAAAYRRRNAKRRKEQNRIYRAKNHARILANQKQWRAENPSYNRDYYAKNRQREIDRVMARKRRLQAARKKNT